MEFRKMVTITLYARQQKRHRCVEWSFGLCGRGRGWDDLGECHWIMYNIIQVQCRKLCHFNMKTAMFLFSHSVVSDSLWPCGLYPVRLLYPWGKNTGVGCHFLLQGISLTERLNLPQPISWHWHTGSLPAESSHREYINGEGCVSMKCSWQNLQPIHGCSLWIPSLPPPPVSSNIS